MHKDESTTKVTKNTKKKWRERRAWSSELSSVGPMRMGAYRWEHRLPRSVRWMSHSTSRLMTADCLRLPPSPNGYGGHVAFGYGAQARIADLSGSAVKEGAQVMGCITLLRNPA